MRSVILLFLLTFSVSASASAFSSSYSELAKEFVAKQYELVMANSQILTAKATPKEAKAIRKDIGKLKIYIDVFQYAYSPASDRDILMEMREQLDEGYEVVGQFKDLYDTMDADEISDELLSQRRQKAIAWKNDFQNKAEIYDYKTFINFPLKGEVYKRANVDLPKFFWKIVKFPENKIDDGQAVLSHLLNGMLEKSVERYKLVMDFESLFVHKDEEAFHDFRKLVRAHLKLTTVFFQSEVSEGAVHFDSYKILEMMVDKFGEINDNLVSLHHAKSKKKKKKLKKKIRIQWYLLKAWMLENDIKDVLKSFHL